MLYYPLYVFVYLLSLLPFGILYVLSDILYIVVYRVLQYRVTTVRRNLANAFPAYSDKQRSELEKKFYKHLCDLIFEVFKMASISSQELVSRCPLDDRSKGILAEYHRAGRQLVIISGHCGNWEWTGSAFQLQCPYPLAVIYRPIRSAAFNRLMLRLRGRFGNRLVPMNEALRHFIGHAKDAHAVAFISDQTPPPATAYWTRFLNQETPVFNGSEKIARKFNYPVLFFHIKKTGRGRYVMELELVSDTPSALPENAITEAHVRILERDILEQPEIWLWSHKRWKHTRVILR